MTPPRAHLLRWSGGLLAALFATLIWLPLAGLPFVSSADIATIQKVEKRKLAQAPVFDATRSGVRRFPRDFERWFNDHIGFRRALVRFHNAARLIGLNSSPVTLSVVGKDGWHYYNFAPAIDSYRRKDPFTHSQLLTWQQTVEARRDWLAARGIRYLFVIVPNKNTIYPEYMPARINRLDHPSRLEQFVAHMDARSDVEVLDLTDALNDAKKDRLTYMKLDTHWNRYGAYVGYRELLTRLSGWFPITPIPLSAFAEQTTPMRHGQLSEMYDLGPWLSETVPKFTLSTPVCAQREKLALAGPYKWSRRRVPFTTRCTKGDLPNAVFFRDSFTDYLIPLLSEHFARADYVVRQYTHPIMTQLIADASPDLVVEQMVERMFYQYQPENDGAMLQQVLPARFAAAGDVRLHIAPKTGQVLQAKKKGELYPLPGFAVDTGSHPIVRLRITSSENAVLGLHVRTGTGAATAVERLVAPLVHGTEDIYFELPVTGQVAAVLEPPVGTGGIVLHEVEARAVHAPEKGPG